MGGGLQSQGQMLQLLLLITPFHVLLILFALLSVQQHTFDDGWNERKDGRHGWRDRGYEGHLLAGQASRQRGEKCAFSLACCKERLKREDALGIAWAFFLQWWQW